MVFPAAIVFDVAEKRIFRDGGAKTKVERGPGGGKEQRG